MRSVPSALSPIHGYRPQAVVEQSGSARTRAPPQNSRPTASSNTTDANTSVDHSHEAVGNIRPRVRLSRVQPISANGSNDGNNNSVGNDEEPQFDAGARFYPGYIPEILITREYLVRWAMDILSLQKLNQIRLITLLFNCLLQLEQDRLLTTQWMRPRQHFYLVEFKSGISRNFSFQILQSVSSKAQIG